MEFSEEFLSMFYDVVESKTTSLREYNENRSTSIIKRRRRNGSYCRVRDPTITITYKLPPGSHDSIGNHCEELFDQVRERIISNYTLLAREEICPHIQSVKVEKLFFSITHIYFPFLRTSNINPDNIVKIVGETVSKLHDLGKYHGNLSVENICLNKDRAYLLSPEYLYDINTDFAFAQYIAINLHDIDIDPELPTYNDELNTLIFLDYEYWSAQLYEGISNINEMEAVDVDNESVEDELDNSRIIRFSMIGSVPIIYM